MTLTDNAKVVLERRIAEKDKDGNAIETPEQIFRRVAHNIALAELVFAEDTTVGRFNAELVEEKFFNMMMNLDFLPNSPTLVNAGRDLQQLSACFVLPVEDSMEGIFESVKQAALIHKTGGGTGFSFTRLRPENTTVSKTSGVASGPVSFMQVFDKATEVIKQGGTRRGANMGILRIDHPDILKFIHIKDDLTKLTNFNISVAVTDKFMEALSEEKDYELIDPKTGEVVGTYNSRDIWDQIIASAHATGDPGVIFIDRINSGKANPVPSRGPIESTNPCGEQPLYPWDSCNLGSINLANFVIDDSTRRIDFARLADVTGDAVHFLDNVITMNAWPNDQIKEVSLSIRRIGLGVMGFADMLIKLGVKYNSDEAIQIAESVMECISTAADRNSIAFGLQRGSFPDKDKSIYKEWPALRNSTRTTIAPTGTISIIAGVSSGIEPVYAFEFVRSHYLDKDPNKRYEMVERHPLLDEWMANHPNEEKPDYFVSAHEIEPEWHVKMQAAFQRYTDNAVSKTINFPKEAKKEEVEYAYLFAYALGCQGITIYRDGSREGQVLTPISKEEVKEVSLPTSIQDSNRRKLNATRQSITHRFTLEQQDYYITVGLFANGDPGEVFIIASKSGSSTQGYLNTIGTLLSYSLQYGVPLGSIVEKLVGTRFSPNGFTGNTDIPVTTSVVDYVVRWLRRMFIDKSEHEEYTSVPSGEMCPDCDSPLFFGEGCLTCISCGYSKCG